MPEVALVDVKDLPVLAREPACPAALAIAGACPSQQGVVCRIMKADQEADAGVDMTAGALGVLREAAGGVYLNLKGDPSSVVMFCHGRAVPVLTDDDDKRLARASFTRCPVWQAEKNRIAEGRDSLVVASEPESVSAGDQEEAAAAFGAVSSLDAADPWEQARRDLDVLAPPDEL